jgi:hypothetical protein
VCPVLVGCLDLRRDLGFNLGRDAKLLDQFIRLVPLWFCIHIDGCGGL